MNIKPYENNAKKHPEKQVELIANSIKRFGWQQPIVVDSEGTIIVGHGRYLAWQKHQTEEPWITDNEGNTIQGKQGKKLTGKEIKAYRLADNKINESDWDMDLVIEELKELDELVPLTGFDLEEKYDDFEAGSIRDRFLVPPFSVLNTREGEWQSRKKRWLALGIKSELGRDDDTMGSGLTTLSSKQSAEGSGLTGTSIFDPVLCELMYLWFAPEKANIIDPFAGGSVRGIVAAKLGHTYMGTELRAEQVEANRVQANEIVPDNQPIWVADDALNIKNHFKEVEFDMQLTCPPYADLEVYSDDPKDLSTMEYDKFVEVYTKIIKESCDLLKDKTFAVCVVGEVRNKDGTYKNFVQDTIKAYQDAGLHFYNEIILVNMIGTLGMRITKQFNAGRKVGKTHQNTLVFWKGDPKAINSTVKSWNIKGDLFSTEEDE